MLENEVGHRAEARRRLKSVSGDGEDLDAERLSMAAFISASIGRTTKTTRMLDAAERLGRQVLSFGVGNQVEARARVALAFVAVERGDADSAREQYDALLPYRGVMTNGHPPVTDRVLGLLAKTLGRIDDAASHFEHALALCRDRFHGEQGHVSYEYAVLLFSRRGPGDRERAIELMFDAYAKCHWVSHDRMMPLYKRVMDLSRAEGWSYPMRELHVSIEEGRFGEYLRRYRLTPEQMSQRHIYGSSVITAAALTRDPVSGKRGRNREVLKALIDAGAEFDIIGAVAWGLNERVEELLDDDPSVLNIKWGFGSLMNVAFEYDQLETAKLLMRRGFSLPIPMGGSDEWIRWAVSQGASPDGPRGDGWPLNHQAGHGRMRGVAALLELGADPNPQDEQGNTPMHRLAQRGTGREFARLLLEQGADLSIKNVKGETPMDLAARAKQPALLKFLREHVGDEDR
ncbi:MAG: ankyrin repeat domain-containing protein [Chloroflexi bacterium]|nr:ankyrin repeat domain-containing protein [Chloroflexota bacterium]